MKNLKPQLIEMLKKGGCTPRLSQLSKSLHTRASTLHYNIKSMEKDGTIKVYKAVFDYKKIGEGLCTFVLVNLASEEYGDPLKIAKELAKYPEIESVDVITGEWELLLKVRTASIDEYYEFARKVLSVKGIAKTQALNSLKQVKTEFVTL
jgi:Lrp/AsnC family transcriptional regulator, leucine-responsive regulatory protein